MTASVKSGDAKFLLALAICIPCGWPVFAEESDLISNAKSLLDSNECAEAWKILWTLTLTGDDEASAVILGALYVTLTPPMKSQTDENLHRANAFFAVSSIPFTAGDSDFNQYRLTWLDHIWPRNDPDRLSCVSPAPPAKCMGLAFARGYAPRLEYYSADISSAEVAGISASCRKDQY